MVGERERQNMSSYILGYIWYNMRCWKIECKGLVKHSHEEKCVLDRRKVQCLKCKVKLYSSEKFAIYNKIKFRIKIVIYLAS